VLKRYRLVLDPCEATGRAFWNQVMASADRLADVFDQTSRPYQDQKWHILDSKTGKVISREEFWKIISS
jgi:hypothetical protein